MKHPLLIVLALMTSSTFAIQATAQESARFKAMTAEQLTPEQKIWADAISAPPRNAKFGNPPYRAYIQAPELATRLSALSDYLRWKTSLPARLSEMAILITAREWTAQYEWLAHYPLAIKGGLDVKIADTIALGKRPEGMKPDETALYDLVTDLYRDKKVSDASYKAAKDAFGERGIMDIIGIIGYYDLVSMTLNTMEAKMPNDSVKPLPILEKKP
jgi:4-carboxymuconolactone decarboxylase